MNRGTPSLPRLRYNQHYGEQTDGTNARFLKDCFKSTPMPFLGCSLAEDRTMKLLKQINESDSLPHFALIGQEADPVKFQAQGQRLSAAGIRPIWHPPGQHDFVGVFPALVTHVWVGVWP